HRLVDRVVEHLAHEVMETTKIRRADVHARAAANGLEALEDLDVLRAIGPALVGVVRRQIADGHVLSLCLAGADQQLVEPLEVLVGVELDRDAAAATAAEDLHLRAERGTELARELREIGIATAQP